MKKGTVNTFLFYFRLLYLNETITLCIPFANFISTVLKLRTIDKLSNEK